MTHPNIPYKPFAEGAYEQIPEDYRRARPEPAEVDSQAQFCRVRFGGSR
jgi:hypothetical protein